MVISGWCKAPSIVIFFKISKDLKNKKIRCLRNWTKMSTPIENIPAIKKTTDFPGGTVVKNPPTNAGDGGSVPGSGRSPGGGNGTPLQYSCLENSRDGGAWRAILPGVTESDKTEQPSARAHTPKLYFVCLKTQVQGSFWHKVFLFIPVKHVGW